MIEGKTATGFRFNLTEDVTDDMELLEGLIKLDKGDVSDLPEVITALMGDKQKEKLYNHCRDKKTGRVKASKVLAEVGEIFKAAEGNVKN